MRRRLAVATVFAALVADPVAAHAGSLSDEVGAGAVPSWLLVLSGGVVIAGSFLFVSLLTDHEAITIINGWGLRVPIPGAAVVSTALGVVGVLVLAAIVVVGFVGPIYPTRNLAILWVWGGWWAGYTISVYALGDSWPAVNPWRTLTDWLSAAVDRGGTRSLPGWATPWVSVGGLLALVWTEVVSPVSDNPRFLALVVVAYTVATVGGAWRYGADEWFRSVDPAARVFRVYGRLAPVQRTDDGLELKLPGTALTTGPADDGEAAFVIALLWATTYDGFVTTPFWSGVAETVLTPLPTLPVPGVGDVAVFSLLGYLLVLLAGYVLFLQVYRVAARQVRTSANTYVTVDAIERWFVPSLVPIAAGYHVAHYLGYFVSLSPGLVGVVSAPLAGPGALATQPLPGWFGNVQLVFVVIGHLLAIYVAHAVSFDVFPGKLSAIRSQYPFVFVMVFYTMTSVWIVTQPFTEPPIA